MSDNADLRRVRLLAVLCALVAVLIPWEAVRLVAAVPLALLLSGYAFTAAVFPERRPRRPVLILLVLSGGLSVIVLGGLVLNYLGGLRTWTWAVLLLILIFALTKVARSRRGEDGWPAPELAEGEEPEPAWRPRPLDLVVAGLGVAAAVVAIVIATTPLTADRAEGYTALWIQPSAEGVRVGVASSEQGDAGYRLEVRGGGEVSEYEFALGPGEERTTPVEITRNPGAKTFVSATLYPEGDPDLPYRVVDTWLLPDGPG